MGMNAPTAPPQNPTAPPVGTPPVTQPETPPQGTPPPAPPAEQEGDTEPQFTPEQLKYVQGLRREAAGHRTTAKRTLEDFENYKKKVSSIVGGNGDQPVAPDEVASKLAEKDARIRTLEINNALHSEFARQGVIPDLGRAVLKDRGEYDKLDPNAADFAKDLRAAVKAAAEELPQIKATPAPTPPKGPNSGEFQGGSNQPHQLTREDALRMSPEQVEKAHQAGQFNQLLGRK